MKKTSAIKTFAKWDARGRYVYTLNDLAKLFPEDGPRTLQEGINRLVKAEILQRVSRGVYVYALSQGKDSHVIEQIARTLRRGEYNYVSLESALSEFGAISQIPIDRLTVMTTGRKGEYRTPYGTIEFTHTKRKLSDVLNSMMNVGRPLRLARPMAAWRDLKRVGRNTQLVNEEALLNAGSNRL
jgi:predicted transcriptional regulator of viral defense system